MSEDDDSTASYWVKRAEHKQCLMSAEAEDRVVTRNHQKRLKHQPAHFSYSDDNHVCVNKS